MTNLMKPIVTLNGTCREDLIDQRLAAMGALQTAMEALQRLAPHGRDYIGEPDAYKRDRAIYQTRFAALDAMRNELSDEAVAIQDGVAA